MTNLNTTKIVVMGSKRVGKSALTVRYLTKRFIGEYRSNTDLLYKQTITLDNATSEIEVLDVSRWTNEECFPLEHIRWADAFVVVYSVCDRDSFNDAHNIMGKIQKLKPSNYAPVILLGNKRDLEHARVVGLEAGQEIAVQYGCQFYEVSAAENYVGVCMAFQSLLRETRSIKLNHKNLPRQRKLSMFAVSKMIGAIIGHGKNTAKTNVKKKRPSLSL